jgi:hypothetical protein
MLFFSLKCYVVVFQLCSRPRIVFTRHSLCILSVLVYNRIVFTRHPLCILSVLVSNRIVFTRHPLFILPVLVNNRIFFTRHSLFILRETSTCSVHHANTTCISTLHSSLTDLKGVFVVVGCIPVQREYRRCGG